MPKNIQCSVVITEIDGKLSIIANIPDNAGETIPGLLAKALIERGREIMNSGLCVEKAIQKMTTN